MPNNISTLSLRGESVRVTRNGKPIADIVPIVAEVPSWKRRSAQPIVLDSISVSRMIIEERQTGFYRSV
jgi:antitoxin (DNA-binding transcriptional repressor) of toxin-antitoxin stability system